MFFALSKIFHFILLPLNWILFLLLMAWILRKRSPRLSRLSAISALCVLIIMGNAPLQDWVVKRMEYPREEVKKAEHFRYAVILSGFASVGVSGDLDLGKSADRLLAGLELLHADQADTLILSGGSGLLKFPDLLESVAVARKFPAVFQGRVIVESASRNTSENALRVKDILELRTNSDSFWLITSAIHMPRALESFQRNGLRVRPLAVDHRVQRPFVWASLLPSAHHLSFWSELLHEWIGRVVYRYLKK